MKKIFSLILSLMLVFNMSVSTFAAEGDPNVTLSVDKASVTEGEKVTVAIGVDKEVSGILTFGMDLIVDADVFEVEDILLADDDFEATDSVADKDKINFLKFTTKKAGMTVNEGTIVTVVLKAKKAVNESEIKIEGLGAGKNVDNVATAVPLNSPSAVSVTVLEKPAFEGYAVHGGEDVSTTENGNAVVSVNVTHSDEETNAHYNAYDVSMSYDQTKLQYVEGTAPDDDAEIIVDEVNGTIRVIGYGKDKAFTQSVTDLTFKMISSGAAEVTITSAKVNDRAQAIEADAEEVLIDGGSDNTPSKIVVAVPYSVEKPDFVTGADTVLPGNDYTFGYKDSEHYDYSDLIVKVGEKVVTPVLNDDGTYTISSVDGKIVIDVTQTAKSYKVNFKEVTDVKYTGSDKASYGTDYTFTVTTEKVGYAIGTVTASYKTASGKITITPGSNNTYTIKGDQIIDEITVEATLINAGTHTTITFTGNGAEDVVDGNQQTAKIGEDFKFALNKAEGYAYTVMLGETELLVDNDGYYTVPKASVVAGGVTITVTKELIVETTVAVDSYITLNGKTMYLVTASKGSEVLAYNGQTMFKSSAYDDAYCWLIISGESKDAVLETAKEKLAAADKGAEVTEITYDFDVNKTGSVDVNDAQITYDMYTALYDTFEAVTMEKFLKADVNSDKTVSTADAAAIVNKILNRTETAE